MLAAFHPAGILGLWILIVIGLQFSGWIICGSLALAIFLSAPKIIPRFLKTLYRNRFLLIALWLVIAYQTPGDLWRNLQYAPTDQGIHSAWLQTLRFTLMLAALTWLHNVLKAEAFLLALYTLLKPLGFFKIKTERFIVRLALVLENFEQSPPKFSLFSWQEWLLFDDSQKNSALTVEIQQMPWRFKDNLLILIAIFWLALLIIV